MKIDELEMHVLAALMFGNKELNDKIFGSLDESLFSTSTRKDIFRAFKNIYDKTGEIEIITSVNQLKKLGINTLSLLDIYSEIPSAHRLDYWIPQLQKERDKRNIRQWLHDAQQNMNGNASEIVNELVGKLETVTFGIKEFDYNDFMLDVFQDIEERKNTDVGVKSNYKELDDIIGGWYNGKLYTLAGYSGHGKTAMALNFANRISLQSKKVLFFTLELPAKEIGIRHVALNTRIPYWKLERGDIQDNDWKKITKNYDLTVNKIIVIDNAFSLSDIETSIIRHSPFVIFVDYVGLMDLPKAESKAYQLSETARQLKIISKRHDIAVVMLWQANRESQRYSDKKISAPKIYHLFGSSGAEQHSDVVMIVWWPFKQDSNRDKNQYYLAIEKQRGGSIGTIELIFDPEPMRIKSLSEKEDDEMPF